MGRDRMRPVQVGRMIRRGNRLTGRYAERNAALDFIKHGSRKKPALKEHETASKQYKQDI